MSSKQEEQRMPTHVDCPTCGDTVQWSEKAAYRPFSPPLRLWLWVT
ncbi:DNA gyrase inhibitor YacG, partial [Idiomarina sp.]